MQIFFWTAIGIVIYSYFGYGLQLWLMRLFPFARRHSAPSLHTDVDAPHVALLIAAWNEQDFILEKLRNTNKLDYPGAKLTVYIITDGSTDDTAALAQKFAFSSGFDLQVHHRDGRSGKQAAIERVLPLVEAPIVVFTDANTYLNPMAIRNLVRHYKNPQVAAVAGEKRIMQHAADAAAGAGEGLYWKFESTLKQWDSEFHTVVGAAGELFSVRRSLIPAVPPGTLVEDFYTTMKLCEAGYRVAYAPDAFAEETSSANIKEEMKRKVRIAAGGLQAAARLQPLLNPFRDWKLTFQYVGHRLLRWTLGPLMLPIILILNVYLAEQYGGIYTLLLIGQGLFYLAAILGYLFEKQEVRFKLLFVPMYFTMMNIAVYRGFVRLLRNTQQVTWDKAERAAPIRS